MPVLHSLTAALALLVGAQGARHQARTDSIVWGKCDNASAISPTLQCASFNVQLDYTNPGRQLTLSLYRYPAKKLPSKGTIFMNFGGPGEPAGNRFGGADTTAKWPVLANFEYDFVGWDPRGTGNTIPFTCNPANVTLGFEKLPALTLEDKWTAADNVSQNCYQAQNATGGLLGSPFNARDILAMADALGIQTVNYWGFSYGTVIGATFAALFPVRVGQILLDGNVNIAEVYDGRQREGFSSAPAAFDGFFAGCAATPEDCALATRNDTTAAQIKAKVLNLFKLNGTETAAFVAARRTLASAFFKSLYAPDSWIAVAAELQSVLTGIESNASTAAIPPSPFPSYGFDAARAITFADNAYRAASAGEVAPSAAYVSAFDPAYDFLIPSDPFLVSARWRFRAREGFVGPWRVKPAGRILLVGNTYDPVTPVVSARNNSAMLQGSVVLTQDGYGHTSSSQPSLCTSRYVMAFWRNGTLPPVGTVCKPDVKLFSNYTSTDFYEQLKNGTLSVYDAGIGSNNSTGVKGSSIPVSTGCGAMRSPVRFLSWPSFGLALVYLMT